MITRRTKVLLWLSSLPLIAVLGGAAWVAIYPVYLDVTHQGDTSTFVIFHTRHLLGITIVFVCGLISLIFDRRMNGAK